MKEISGTLFSGLNKGKKFLAMPEYSKIFHEKLNHFPFAGTLNLRISDEAGEILNQIIKEKGVLHNNIVNSSGEKMGGIINLPVILKDAKGRFKDSVLVRPLLTVYSKKVVEIVSFICFREEWGLKDGAKLKVII